MRHTRCNELTLDGAIDADHAGRQLFGSGFFGPQNRMSKRF